MRLKCLAQEHSTMCLARARTWTANSGVECTNHDATAPPTMSQCPTCTHTLKLHQLPQHQERCIPNPITAPTHNLPPTQGAVPFTPPPLAQVMPAPAAATQRTAPVLATPAQAQLKAASLRATFRAIPFFSFYIFVRILTFITYNVSSLVFTVFMLL